MDLWSDHTPWPYNQIPKSYSFLVQNSFLWRFGYYTQQPRFVHRTSQRLACPIVRRRINEAYDLYQPDLVVSVHPLMQMVPLQVLRERIRWGLLGYLTGAAGCLGCLWSVMYLVGCCRLLCMRVRQAWVPCC